MKDLENVYGQNMRSEFGDDSESDDDIQADQTNNLTRSSTINNQNAQEIAEIFQRNIKEQKLPLTIVQIRRTVRDKIFPFMKFTNEEVLREVKLREHNNIIHLLLQDLNRLEDDDRARAKFWLAYKSEVKSILTTRKTEVSNGMKETVVECKYY